MLIVRYEASSAFRCYVPNYCIDEHGNKLSIQYPVDIPNSIEVDATKPFELPDGKWFGMDEGIIERFPIDKEWDWRILKAQNKIKDMMSDPEVFSDSLKQINIMESCAKLCGINLPEFVQLLHKASLDGEDLEVTFNRIKDEQRKEYEQKDEDNNP